MEPVAHSVFLSLEHEVPWGCLECCRKQQEGEWLWTVAEVKTLKKIRACRDLIVRAPADNNGVMVMASRTR